MTTLTIGQRISRDLCEADLPLVDSIEVSPDDVSRRIDEAVEELRQQLSEVSELNSTHAFNAKYFKSEYEKESQQLSAAQADSEQLVKALERCKFDSLNMTFDDLKFIREVIAAHKARQAKCDPTLTLCPRCNNDIFKCDGAYKARQQGE